MPVYTITAPNGKEYEVEGPEGSTQEEALAHFQSQYESGNVPQPDVPQPDVTQPVEPYNPRKGPIYRVAQGLADPIMGLSQLAMHGANLVVPGASKGIDEFIANEDKLNKEANPGFDSYNMLGRAANPLNFILLSKLPKLVNAAKTFSALPKIAKAGVASAPVGYMYGVSNPVVDAKDYANSKMKDINLSTALSIATPLAVSAAGTIGRGLGNVMMGLTGGRGSIVAYDAGKAGGDAAKGLIEHMRGYGTGQSLVDEAKVALGKIKDVRNTAYQTGMADISQDKQIIPMQSIYDALNNVNHIKVFKGQDLSTSTKQLRSAITNTIDDWSKLNPAEFHTPAGIDALKQKISDIGNKVGYGVNTEAQRALVDSVYSGIKGVIAQHAPKYAEVMKGYERATNDVRELERVLSLGKPHTIDSALRKLQGSIKSEYRSGLVKKLGEESNLIPKIAGETLKDWVPHGFGKVVALGATGLGTYSHSLPMATLAASQSPRLMGELALLTGRMNRPIAPLVSPLLTQKLLYDKSENQ